MFRTPFWTSWLLCGCRRSTDVLEHVPEKLVPAVVQEFARVRRARRRWLGAIMYLTADVQRKAYTARACGQQLQEPPVQDQSLAGGWGGSLRLTTPRGDPQGDVPSGVLESLIATRRVLGCFTGF